MTDDDPELEFSPLCGRATRHGITVGVHIFRRRAPGQDWLLEIIDPNGGSTVWDEAFLTDQDAYRGFYKILATEGIAAVWSPAGTRY